MVRCCPGKKEREKMISNQILQNTIDGLKAIGRIEFCVVDAEGKTFTELSKNSTRLKSFFKN